MGARAHYIRRSGGVWQLRYSQWGAETIDRDIFWGPEHTRSFIDAQAERGPDDWMDEVWCEGAVLMDEDRRQLLFFGGMASGSLHEKLLRAVWDGWEVRPCTLPEIAAALGVDPSQVESHYEPEPLPLDWEMSSGNATWTVVTLARNGTVDAFAVDELIASLVALGPDRLLAAGAGTTLTYDELSFSGLHVDSDHMVAYWWPGARHSLAPIFASVWPGWTVEALGDNFEAHVELARGAFTVHVPPQEENVAEVRDYLLAETGTNPTQVRARFEATHEVVHFATDFETPIPVRLTLRDRTRIVDAAIATLSRT